MAHRRIYINNRHSSSTAQSGCLPAGTLFSSGERQFPCRGRPKNHQSQNPRPTQRKAGPKPGSLLPNGANARRVAPGSRFSARSPRQLIISCSWLAFLGFDLCESRLIERTHADPGTRLAGQEVAAINPAARAREDGRLCVQRLPLVCFVPADTQIIFSLAATDEVVHPPARACCRASPARRVGGFAWP